MMDGDAKVIQSDDGGDRTVRDYAHILTEGLKTGKCKWFNGTKGWGFVTLDNGGYDVFVHQSILQMKGFRQLGESEEVEIDFRLTDRGLEAVKVTGPNGEDCRGSKGPHPSRRVRKIRCYNCGEFKNHVASKCEQPLLPKRCHHCKSLDHLIADCPDKPVRATESPSNAEQSSADTTTSSSLPPVDGVTETIQNIKITE